MAGEMLCNPPGSMNINVKTKIRYNGRDYSSPNELPPEVRSGYEKALAGAAQSKVTINGQEFGSETEMPEEMRNFAEDVIALVQNNGEVTLPVFSRSSAPRVTKGQMKLILAVAGALILGALTIVATSIR
jgi:hypothetical protein